MGRIKVWLKQILTEDDNATLCVAKILAVLAVFSFFGYAAYGLYKDHFALSEFASGLMQVLLGSGGVILGKQLTQQKQ